VTAWFGIPQCEDYLPLADGRYLHLFRGPAPCQRLEHEISEYDDWAAVDQKWIDRRRHLVWTVTDIVRIGRTDYVLLRRPNGEFQRVTRPVLARYWSRVAT
jgi:hypothetical protein